jgi:hypothetical protein
LLKFNSKVQVHHTSTWKKGETFKYRLFQWYVSHYNTNGWYM